MNMLTINFIVQNKQQFTLDNKIVLEEIKKIDGIFVGISEICSNKYQAYKELLERTDSQYTMFYDEENVLDVDVLKTLVQKLENVEEPIAMQRIQANPTGITECLPGGMTKIALYFNCYIFQTERLKKVEIAEKEIPYFEEKILLELTKNLERILIFDEIPIVTTTPLEKNVNSYAKQFDKNWYLPFMEEFLLPYVKQHSLSVAEQRWIVYFIILRFYLNANARDKQVIQGEEVEQFWTQVKEVVSHIEDKYLIEVSERGMLPQSFNYLLLREKHQELTWQAKAQGKHLYYSVNREPYGMDCMSVRLFAINYEKGKLIFDGELIGDYCIPDVETYFSVVMNGEKQNYIKTDCYNIWKAFGKSTYRYYPFQFEIPETELTGKQKIEFKVYFNNEWIRIPIQFIKVSSRLVRSRWSYFAFSDKMISYWKDTLIVKQRKNATVLLHEVGLALKTFKNKKKITTAIKSIGFRGLYWLTRKQYSKKPIWIFYDKLYKAGDNAEYLFRYCMEHFPEVDCYYILNKDANEYSGLKKQYGKHIVVFESLRNRLAVLNARYIFATHAVVYGYCGFNKALRTDFKHLLSADIVCIQHGLTIQNIAQYQSRLSDNTKKYFCASKYEIENLRQPIYGYKEEDLCLTGCPRYDGLINQDKKQILISPTWRRNIVITGNKMGTAKSYNPDFKYTKYFEIYNSLINDERLVSTAKEYGYKLVFLIHPTLSSQIEDYDTNDYLTIIPAVSDVSYEKMLTESSLMLTDYSGIQFDFAYMKKPILYYHPTELPPQYTEGVYQYETMGFGPIIENYDDIIEAMCASIRNGCKMEEKYVERVEDFFAYTDHSNCKRIMEEMMKE